MEHTLRQIKLAITGFAGAITVVFGWLGWLVILWVGCMAADYLTGSALACKNGQWNSAKAREGLWHKVGMLAAVAVAAVVDLLIGSILPGIPGLVLPFTYETAILPLTLVWYILTELGSIAENAVKMGAKVPAFLQKALQVAQAGLEKEKPEPPKEAPRP